MEKMPLLKPLIEAGEKDQFKDALDTERLAIGYKVKREEILSIFDEVKEYLDYESIIGAENFGGLSDDLQENITAHLSEYKKKINSDSDSRNILFSDFKNLWQENPEIFMASLMKAIQQKERKSISETASGDVDKKTIDEMIKMKTIGKTARAGCLMALRFNRLNAELDGMSEEEIDKIKLYTIANFSKVKKALGDIKEMREGIQSAKDSKRVDVIRKTSETAKIHNVNEDDIKSLNFLLESIFKKEFGGKFSLGVEEKYDKTGNIVDKDFIAAYVNYSREMKNLYAMLNEGQIVETAYIKKIIEQAMPALKKNPPTIVYFHGDFGTGKTALAIHIAKTKFKKDPIVVAGSKYIEPDRFTEEFKISKTESRDFLNQMMKDLGKKEVVGEDDDLKDVMEKSIFSKQELREDIKEKLLRRKYEESLKDDEAADELIFEEFAKRNSAGIEKDVDREMETLFSNQVQGRYVLGSMYKAMKEGRPLIIDEANAISPDVLISFNDLMTKKIGEKIKTRADEKEIKIKDGYCVMWTGNTGERYAKARFNDIDPATFSRIAPIKINYLPQSTEVSNMNFLLERLDLEKLEDKVFADNEEMLEYVKLSKKQAAGDQIFQVMLIKLLNKRMGAEMLVKKDDRYSVFKDIYRLSMGARIIMDMFEGKADSIPNLPNIEKLLGVADSASLIKKLKKSNLTMRELMDNIIGGYLDDGQAMDIEYYLYNFVQKQGIHPEEQAILYAILQKTGFFKIGEGWPDYQKCAGNTDEALAEFGEMMGFSPVEAIDKYKKIQKNGDYAFLLNTEGKYKYEYFSSLETLQLLYGYLPPRQKEDYASIKNKQKEIMGDEEQDERREELIESLNEIKNLLSADLFKTTEQAEKIRDAVYGLRISDKDKKPVSDLSAEEFFAEVVKFNEIMLEFLIEIKKISDEEYEEALGIDSDQQVEFIKDILNC